MAEDAAPGCGFACSTNVLNFRRANSLWAADVRPLPAGALEIDGRFGMRKYDLERSARAPASPRQADLIDFSRHHLAKMAP